MGVVLAGIALASPASAHETSAYSHDSNTGTTNPDWMSHLADSLRLSELSIPGTHDSGAYEFGGDAAFTQSMNLSAQLNAGIRVLDIRLHESGDSLEVYHGIAPQGLSFKGDVLGAVDQFLADHPEETVVMRIKEEHGSWSDFSDLVQDKLAGSPVYRGTSDNPTLGQMRGKIVVLNNYDSSDFGIPWGSLSIQDDYEFADNWDMARKWNEIKTHLVLANIVDIPGALDTTYVNFLSGASGSFPYFVASGHSDPSTGGPQLLTGWTRGVIDTCGDTDKCIPEFPSVNCALGTCSVAFLGTNELTMDLLNSGDINRRAGIVMSDFPGAGLIQSIINLNPFIPPIAVLGGPYVASEGSQVTLSAAASFDLEGSPLTFRWDFDGDGSWDTAPSAQPTVKHVYPDDWSGQACVEVSDAYSSATRCTQVTINNVAPRITASGDHIDENGVATVGGTITDPGTEDSFTVTIDWGEGTPQTYSYPAGTTSYSEQHQYLDDNPSGTASDDYPISVTVRDDDGGTGSATADVTVDNVAPVTSIGAIRDASGATLGPDRVALTYSNLDLEGAFTDVGTQDTHTATVNWGDQAKQDLGATTGQLTASHVYTVPGSYSVALTVTDDDTGVDTATFPLTVLDSSSAMDRIVDQVLGMTDAPGISHSSAKDLAKAVANLRGNHSGKAANGALDQLAKGNLVATLEKIRQADGYLEAAQGAGGPDLSSQRSLLAMTADSIAAQALHEASTAGHNGRRIDEAGNQIQQGTVSASEGDFAEVNSAYQSAVRILQPILR